MGQALTPMQKLCVELLAQDMPPKKVAAEMNISPRTVEAHIMAAREKLGRRTIHGMVAEAVKRGIV